MFPIFLLCIALLAELGLSVPLAGKTGAAVISLDGPRPTKAPQPGDPRIHHRDIANLPPDYLTIQIVNSYGQDITTAHASNQGCPTPVGGPIPPGVVPEGATAAFAVPTGWAGNVAFNRADKPITGDVSLIEASFTNTSGWPHAVVGIDVSHVNGFTVPIMCSCAGTYVSGCNIDLFAGRGINATAGNATAGNATASNATARYASARNATARDATARAPQRSRVLFNNAAGAAANPLREDKHATAPDPFFEACRGLAYTFPSDHGANSFGECQNGVVDCCVGTACPRDGPASASANATADAPVAPAAR